MRVGGLNGKAFARQPSRDFRKVGICGTEAIGELVGSEPVMVVGRRGILLSGKQRVEGRLFRPMAWTVAFALLGALLFSMLIAPVLSSLFFSKGAREIATKLVSRWRK